MIFKANILIDLVDEMNGQFEQHDEDGMSFRPFQAVFEGRNQAISFFTVYSIWTSEDDQSDATDSLELQRYICEEVNCLMAKFGKIQLLPINGQ